MDSLISAAARALARGDPLGALDRVALRNDAPALALRGIAMAQLGDFPRATTLLRRAARVFGAKEALARARCVVAEAEVALAARELTWPSRHLDAARDVLERHGDVFNAAHARYLAIRRALLLGHIDDAGHTLAGIDPTPLPPALQSIHAFIEAGIALRRIRAETARDALKRARSAARAAGIPALLREIDAAMTLLDTPAARLRSHGDTRVLLLQEVETLFASDRLVIDACRYAVRAGPARITLSTRPVLFALALALGEAWPRDATREQLMARAFGMKFVDETLRARLRVEIGRLRKLLAPLADIVASPSGFALRPCDTREVAVLLRPIDDRHAPLLALLADGESWTSSALALALGTSQRTVQRALDTLAARGDAQSFGQGRGRRWSSPPMPGFATTLLLPPPLPGD